MFGEEGAQEHSEPEGAWGPLQVPHSTSNPASERHCQMAPPTGQRRRCRQLKLAAHACQLQAWRCHRDQNRPPFQLTLFVFLRAATRSWQQTAAVVEYTVIKDLLVSPAFSLPPTLQSPPDCHPPKIMARYSHEVHTSTKILPALGSDPSPSTCLLWDLGKAI